MAVATIPFEIKANGVAFISGTRVTLDSLIYSFLEGATAEEIVQRYPSLDLADVYSAIGYYLHNRSEIDEYLQRSIAESVAVKRENESRFAPEGIRDRLLARREDNR